MNALPFPENSFDLIWSEGAIYVMGFEAGLRARRRLVRPGGHVVVSELSWLTRDPPPEPAAYWAEGHPGMRHVDENVAAARAAGYRVIDHVTLPEHAWWDDYYDPLMARSAELVWR